MWGICENQADEVHRPTVKAHYLYLIKTGIRMFNSDELKQSILNIHNSYIQMLNSQDQLDYVANDTISEADVINYEEDD